MESAISIAVFAEDEDSFEKALFIFLRRVPEYIYLTSDGPLPATPPEVGSDREAVVKYWNGQQVFPVDGISQETCRDFAHTSYGVASISHVAETTRIQGINLWPTEIGARVKASMELHAPYQLSNAPAIPEWLCNGTIDRHFDPVGEVPYTALAVRMGEQMPYTREFVLEQRPAQIGEKVPLFIGFETLTHADNTA